MTLSLPRLYAIVDRRVLEARGLALAAFVRYLAEAGVTLFQYRDKEGSPREILRAAATISGVVAEGECLLVMNDRADLALLAGWPGVHVGQTDLPPEAVRRVLRGGDTASLRTHSSHERPRDERGTQGGGERGGGFVGVSTHTEEQVRAADAGAADYVAVGPVFATGSKADAEPVIGLAGVRRARALTVKPFVAIGGITRANARSVIDAGADSVAVIGALLTPGEQPGKVAEEFQRILR